MRNLLGANADFTRRRVASHFGMPMELITGHTDGDEPFRHMLSRMTPEDRHALLEQIDRRLDDSCRLHVRFDKQAAFEGTLGLYSSADPSRRKERDSLDLEVRLITYPGKREKAIAFICAFIDDGVGMQG